MLQQARRFQGSPEYAPYRRMRQTVEHRLARLMQLGVRRARYFGRHKTLFQLLMAATVANLTLVAGKTGMMKNGPSPATLLSWILKRLTNLNQMTQRLLMPISSPKMALSG